MRVLVVDDNRLAAEATAGALAMAGYAAECVGSAEAALTRHRPGEWDLVITDLSLPGADGWELVARLRAAEPALAVGVLTGWPPKPGEPSADARGAAFLLVKPVDPLELVREVARVADARSALQ